MDSTRRYLRQKFLPEALSVEGKLDDPRRADITLGQAVVHDGGYTGEGGSPTAVVMGRAFPLKATPGQSIRDLDASSLRCAMWTNRGRGLFLLLARARTSPPWCSGGYGNGTAGLHRPAAGQTDGLGCVGLLPAS